MYDCTSTCLSKHYLEASVNHTYMYMYMYSYTVNNSQISTLLVILIHTRNMH